MDIFLEKSRVGKELDRKKKEKREARYMFWFGVLVIGYFVAHYIAYLIAN